MGSKGNHNRGVEYGDFQTPIALADLICRKLTELGISPEIVIEPTCGTGAFIQSGTRAFGNAQRFIGLEINPAYCAALRNEAPGLPGPERIDVREGDFFAFDWNGMLKELGGEILVMGNFPWVTNAAQSTIGGSNLPKKTNFKEERGIAAMTGKSNFDISEFMLIKVAEWFQHRPGHLAMLVKTSVARKFFSHLHKTRSGVSIAALYLVDAMTHFGVAVDACLLYCRFEPLSHNYDYDVFDSLFGRVQSRVGHRRGLIVKDLDTFDELAHLFGGSGVKWRSGVKHDCSAVMELIGSRGELLNGLGEKVEIEPDLLYPLIKGSDVANGRIQGTNRFMIVTQRTVGESTKPIRMVAPRTWRYLENHARYLDSRKSRVYESAPRFSIFGVGSYTFAPWKVAICGLYKNLNFRLIGPIGEKPVVFDDTVYFLGFEDYEEAIRVHNFLQGDEAQKFLSALIFWDEKRPIKTSILNSLKLPVPTAMTQEQLL